MSSIIYKFRSLQFKYNLSIRIRKFSDTRLMEVGSFQQPNPPSLAYDSGQLFLHRVLGYRGVVLFSWPAKMHDKDKNLGSKAQLSDNQTCNIFGSIDDEKPVSRLWYQALIDERDWPYINNFHRYRFFMFLEVQSRDAMGSRTRFKHQNSKGFMV
uniref:Hemimethylated DNA-binding domain-containing protein n=2 Tax=Romanomermis culicivorax TaxID=13658 RepID=A0A915IZR3_ROMCU